MTTGGRLAGKTAFITGLARGQGRAHAIRMAQEGANIVGLDVCAPLSDVDVSQGSQEDLAETVRQVEALDRRIVARVADTRDKSAVDGVVGDGLTEFGSIDVVVANAGTGASAFVWELSEASWQTTIDVNLTGTFHTVRSVLPHMMEAGRGGSIILTASVGAVRALNGLSAYNASKAGIVALAKTCAVELGPYGIRVNAICPGNTRTLMAEEALRPIFDTGDDPDWTSTMEGALAELNPLGVGLMDPLEQANAALWLASDESGCVTGQTIVVDAGWTAWANGGRAHVIEEQ